MSHNAGHNPRYNTDNTLMKPVGKQPDHPEGVNKVRLSEGPTNSGEQKIEGASKVLNGSISDYGRPQIRLHHLYAPSITGGSNVVNGDLDRDAFEKFFCNGS